jgi:RNA polymerase sigma-70 factor (ECF subfamily)
MSITDRALPPPTPPCILQAWSQSQGELRGFLRHHLREIDSPEIADDLLHEVFLRALRQGGGFCALENARAWLFQVARNLLIDHQRAQRPQVELPDDLPQDSSEMAPVDQLAECLPVALAALSAQDRDAIEQCDLAGLGQADYAALRGLSLPAAKSRVQRARARLRTALLERCGVRFDPDTGRVCCNAGPVRSAGPG